MRIYGRPIPVRRNRGYQARCSDPERALDGIRCHLRLDPGLRPMASTPPRRSMP